MAAPPRLEVRGVKRSFGPTLALQGVDLTVLPGEVHALVGENGAGKSTLMKLLVGAVRPDEGVILLDGAPYAPDGPGDARGAGIAMVHQERSLCAHLSIEDNVVLGVEPARFGVVRRADARRIAAEALAEIAGPESPTLRPEAIVRTLSPGDQQLVEIARALARTRAGGLSREGAATRGCRLLILDEPTSSLAEQDVARLFERVRALKERGVSVLYISHFLEELTAIADAYTVIRDGRAVSTGRMAGASLDAIVRDMAGRSVAQLFPRSPRARGEVILEVDALDGQKKASGARTVTGASLRLHRGEVLGVAGLVGAGRTELLRAIFGLDPVVRGEVRVGLHPSADARRASASGARASPGDRLAQGVGMLSEDRKGEGLAVALSIADNVTLSKLPSGWDLPRQQASHARKWIDALAIRCQGPAQAVRDLSGGNQQKVALARLLHHGVDVLLLDEPTRGIDVGSKAQIYALIDRLAASGKAVLFVSSYLPELLGVCDRIAVMRRGALEEARDVTAWDERTLLARVTGAA